MLPRSDRHSSDPAPGRQGLQPSRSDTLVPTRHPNHANPMVQALTLEIESARASDAHRLNRLFEMAPVALLVEDFSGVARSLMELASRGVTDLEARLRDDPTLTRTLIGQVEIVDANPAAVRMLGAESPSLLRGPLAPESLNNEAAEAFIGQFAAMARGDVSWESTFDGADSSGRALPVRLGWAVPHENGIPDYAHVMVSITDVTDLVNTQRQLRSLVAWKDQFTAAVAHELRTPLTGLVGYAELLCGGGLDPADVTELNHALAGQAWELQRLVDDLLVAARAEAGQLEVMVEPVDLRPVVQAALDSARSDICLRGGSPRAVADPVRVRQIVRNLVTNAERYGGPERLVELGMRKAFAFIDVRDSGPAIPVEHHEAMFEPFKRGGARVRGSVGLGLSVARKLARSQGGDLVLFRDGDWNTFRLKLPLA